MRDTLPRVDTFTTGAWYVPAMLYRCAITTGGWLASRLYEIEADEVEQPRVKAMIDAGWLKPEPDLLNVPSTTSRHGVPEIPTP